MHIAQIGTGRVGRPTAYTVLMNGLADELTVCDTKPGLAYAFAEELKHVTASTKIEVEITSCEQDEHVTNADIILISAGKPRIPGIQISRRDLAIQNAKIIRQISEATQSRNPGAKYVVISNPVDAMAMVCKKYTKADFVISTGTNLESLRFRSKIAETLKVPISQITGWVGGEHGDAATPLWSTTKINGLSIDEYSSHEKVVVPKEEITSYVKNVSKLIVDNIGGTEYGPAVSFKDITSAIAKNTGEILSVATPMRFEDLPEPAFIGVPTHLGQSIGESLYYGLSPKEKKEIVDAAKTIYQTYLSTTET